MIQARWLDTTPYFRVHDWWQYTGLFLQRKHSRNPHVWRQVRDSYITPSTTSAIELDDSCSTPAVQQEECSSPPTVHLNSCSCTPPNLTKPNPTEPDLTVPDITKQKQQQQQQRAPNAKVIHILNTRAGTSNSPHKLNPSSQELRLTLSAREILPTSRHFTQAPGTISSGLSTTGLATKLVLSRLDLEQHWQLSRTNTARSSTSLATGSMAVSRILLDSAASTEHWLNTAEFWRDSVKEIRIKNMINHHEFTASFKTSATHSENHRHGGSTIRHSMF